MSITTKPRDSARSRPPRVIRPAWEEPRAPLEAGARGIVLFGMAALIVIPLYIVVLTSFSSQATITAAGGMVMVPGELTFSAYEQILSGGVVTRAVMVSVGITAVGTLISLVVSVMAAYGLSRPGSYAHRPILFFLLITMFFGAGMIPSYLLVSNLGLINSYWSLILPSCISVFNIFLMRGFFMGIDQSIIDSARIDGAGDWRILTKMVLPMSRSVITVIGLFYGVGYWNAFFNATLYINDSEKLPLQVILRSYVLQGVSVPGQVSVGSGEVATLAVQMAVVIIALVPVLIVYPFLQKHISSGVMIGAVKG
ncbi:ABC transporter permease [Cryobacterium zongtaii]|uniref:ABC transporter permease n=1 Tax=Cryobacterium zongtaii TaxID=1259217 RepID=A0A2S3ZJS9_9MICO|nr:carbohydrate ABC transporter permease [Cryobacterium zongtaii]POH68253.1 ABC transporter permease [Cryobacterium zongtaii]